MTLQKIEFNDFQLKIAFSKKERQHIYCLKDQANLLLEKILANTATPEEDAVYYSIKWALKSLGALDMEYVVKVKR